MATLLLTAVGTAIGGPLGGALGAFIGRQADQAIFGSSRQGPRLKELSVTTSSYGQPLPRNFGRMRVAGTIIWSTDLQETATKEGGAKGQPSTTTFSYSASFAVALSSTPLDRIGRIWADGNLLRGSAGDLKVGGALRIYPGTGDNAVDPLIAADRGEFTPAFRDCAYVVFENLQLGDFGNRIPALTFEVFAPNDETVSLAQLVPASSSGDSDLILQDARGFSDEGGAIGSTLATINQVFPLVARTTTSGLRLAAAYSTSAPISVLAEQVSSRNSEEADARHKRRGESVGEEPLALRYYDEDRDYQPSVQRALGLRPDGREIMVDLPAAMNSQGARQLANGNAHRARWRNEHIVWRTGELNPEVGPGSIVRIPDGAGLWLVRTWEWSDIGIELGLDRISPEIAGTIVSDAGTSNAPLDRPVTTTQVYAFETPPADGASPEARTLFVAATSEGAGWRGAALYVAQGGSLIELGSTGSVRAVAGRLAAPMSGSPCLLLEANSDLLVDLPADDLAFESTDVSGLAGGANRVMIGNELVQFLEAEPLGGGLWRLRGLLRGRAGTEPASLAGHPAGTSVILLDDRLTPIDSASVPNGSGARIAAIGVADENPAYAEVQNAGLSRRAIMPVAPRIVVDGDANWQLCWTRRARGQWTWPDGVEVPLVEEQELYTLGYGPCDAPYIGWSLAEPSFSLSQEDRDGLRMVHGPGEFWVRQVGSFGESPALRLASLS